MAALRAVVFDWGGTLTPWHDIDLFAQWYAYAEVYDPVDAAALAHRLAGRETERWARQRDSSGATSTGALDSLFTDEGIDITGARHLRALGSYLDFWAPHTIAHPQAGELLQCLRDRGLLVGVLSNTMWPRSYHQEVFARDELDGLIDAAVYTSELDVAKPHADAFAAIASGLGVLPAECAYVGDRLWDDVHGAQQAGMRAIHVPHSRIPADQVPDASAVPDAIAVELIDVLAVIESWR